MIETSKILDKTYATIFEISLELSREVLPFVSLGTLAFIRQLKQLTLHISLVAKKLIQTWFLNIMMIMMILGKDYPT